MARPSTLRLAVAVAIAVATAAAAETVFWVDEQGVTHLTDDPSSAPAGARDAVRESDALRGLWDTPKTDGPPVGGPTSSPEETRIERLLRGAVEDLERGENAQAVAALTSVLRLDPTNPRAHWYRAHHDRKRGRYASAEVHLRAFLASAGDDLEPWRVSAQQQLAALADEQRLASEPGPGGPESWLEAAGDDFRVYYRSELARASPGYARTVLGFLREAYDTIGARLGAVPSEPMGVLFYGKAAYLQAHRHRFSFQTVGFFDGRIHVVSAAHPAGELRALLFHEYTHAVYREQTGTDRPFWLNEGLAELSERDSRKQPALTRSERSALLQRIRADDWLPLSRLAPGFSGLGDSDARAAYLESTAAAKWIEERTEPAARARMLAALGEGTDVDEALVALVGLDTDGIDAAVRESILAEFPADMAPGS